MGICGSKHEDQKFQIHVYTGDRKGAGTDANVWLAVIGRKGVRSRDMKLNHTFGDEHERGEKSSFSFSNNPKVRSPAVVEFWRDESGLGDAWFVDRITVQIGKKEYHFPVQRWIKPNKTYRICRNDCCLPQYDKYGEERRMELEEKRQLYKFTTYIPDGPAQIAELPEDEEFSENYFCNFLTTKVSLLAKTTLINWTTDPWESLEDLKKVYSQTLGMPESVTRWQGDDWFALQRLQGLNPLTIQLCRSIPDKFGVDTEHLKTFLEGYSLEEALTSNKLFIVDLHQTENIVCKLPVCSPIALFYVNKRDNLIPLAIQLFQQKSPNNPVFYPDDPPYTWLMVKLWYNNADAHFHQGSLHLACTHLIMEGICISMHRHLSPSHPVFKIVAPHCLYLLAINMRGLKKLLNPGGWVDSCMSSSITGLSQLIAQGVKQWSVDKSGVIPTQIASRGLLDENILPNYHYRDDAIAIFYAIKRYVEKIVYRYYKTTKDLLNDYELQNWRKELVLGVQSGGVGLKGVPGDDERGFSQVEQVATLVTVIIATCSLGHAAANFQQYEAYGFPPNYPAMLLGEPPTTKAPLSEKDIIAAIPSKKKTLDTMVITKLLSMKGTKSLGDFEVQYLFHPKDVKAADLFREELKIISEKIKKRNEDIDDPYPWLDPEAIPNSISI